MRPHKKPKYQLDPKKIEMISEQKEKKDKDWESSEIFNEILRSKTKHRH